MSTPWAVLAGRFSPLGQVGLRRTLYRRSDTEFLPTYALAGRIDDRGHLIALGEMLDYRPGLKSSLSNHDFSLKLSDPIFRAEFDLIGHTTLRAFR
jgi:hypothetical protein